MKKSVFRVGFLVFCLGLTAFTLWDVPLSSFDPFSFAGSYLPPGVIEKYDNSAGVQAFRDKDTTNVSVYSACYQFNGETRCERIGTIEASSFGTNTELAQLTPAAQQNPVRPYQTIQSSIGWELRIYYLGPDNIVNDAYTFQVNTINSGGGTFDDKLLVVVKDQKIVQLRSR